MNKLFGFLIGYEKIQPTVYVSVPNRIDLSPIEPHWKLPFLLRGAYTLCEVEEFSSEVSLFCAHDVSRVLGGRLTPEEKTYTLHSVKNDV